MDGSKIFRMLDIFPGYLQVNLAIKRKKSALCYKFRPFRFEVMPFALMNAPCIFKRKAESLFKDLEFLQVYTDDNFIRSRCMERHITLLIASGKE